MMVIIGRRKPGGEVPQKGGRGVGVVHHGRVIQAHGGDR